MRQNKTSNKGLKPLFDTHCHLDLFLQKSGLSIDAILQACAANQVTKIMIPGLEPDQWPQLAMLCEQHEALYFAVGLHPWWIQKIVQFKQHQSFRLLLDTLSHDLSQWATHTKCIAVGETGLDALIDTPMADQIKILQLHIELAQSSQKPLLLHSRKTDHEMLKQLKAQSSKASSLRGILHGFSGHHQTGKAFIQQGLMLGIGGTITYPRARKTRLSVSKIPLDYLVLETDAPDMPLKGFQGQLNTPIQLSSIAQCLAELRQESVDSICDTTTGNANRIFRLGESINAINADTQSI